MGPDDSNTSNLAGAAGKIIRRRDELLAEREEIRAAREELLARSRRVEREISDCRAAARFFELQIDIPEDRDARDFEQMEFSRRMRERERQEATGRLEAQRRAAEDQLRRNVIAHRNSTLLDQPEAPITPENAQPRAAVIPAIPMKKPRPSIREIILDRLRVAGDKGSKAAPIRDYIEHTYGEVVHEKTVGMTLYRLQNLKLVRRDGHTWFFAPQTIAETKNPGAGTPGSFDDLL
jgi:hypothetical protein